MAGLLRKEEEELSEYGDPGCQAEIAGQLENPYPSEPQVVECFRQEGFLASKGRGGYVIYINEDPGLGILDFHPGNFIVTVEGIKSFDIHFEILQEDSVAAISRILE